MITLGLYPPLPNSLFFLTYIFNAETNALWYLVVITLYFGNFFISMKVLEKSIFGKKNPGIHYVDLDYKDKVTHVTIMAMLVVLSFFGVKEILLWVL